MNQSNTIHIARISCPSLVDDLQNSKLVTTTVNHAIQATRRAGTPIAVAKFQGIYLLDHPTTRRLFGAPDCRFDGDVRYNVYFFQATDGRKKQSFVLYADPRNSDRGSSLEFNGPLLPKFVKPILLWADSLGKTNDERLK